MMTLTRALPLFALTLTSFAVTSCGMVTVLPPKGDQSSGSGSSSANGGPTREEVQKQNDEKQRKAVDDALAARKKRQADADANAKASEGERAADARAYAEQEEKNRAERDKVAKANGLNASALGIDAFLTSAVTDGTTYQGTLVFIDDIDESKCIQALPDKCLFQIETDGQPILYWLGGTETILEGSPVSSTPIGAVKITGVATHKTALGSRQAFVAVAVVQ